MTAQERAFSLFCSGATNKRLVEIIETEQEIAGLNPAANSYLKIALDVAEQRVTDTTQH